MKKLLMIMLVSMVIILSLNFVSANSGSIWTTRNGCDTPQNENEYNIGDHVWIRGDNFDAGEYSWEIKGQPGQASTDPWIIVKEGSYAVDSTGSFCFDAYTVENGDFGVYKAYFDNKFDSYHAVPEFGLIMGIFTFVASIGIFFFVRK